MKLALCIVLAACEAASPGLTHAPTPPAPPSPAPAPAVAAPAPGTAPSARALPVKAADLRWGSWWGCSLTKAELEADLGHPVPEVPEHGVMLSLVWFTKSSGSSETVVINIAVAALPNDQPVAVTGTVHESSREPEGGVSGDDTVEGTIVAHAGDRYDVTLTAHDMMRGMFNPTDGMVHHGDVPVTTVHHVDDCR